MKFKIMKEIKFRLHDKDGKIIGYEIHKQNEYGCWQIYHTSLRGDWADDNDEKNVREGYFIAATFKCMYTGLKDKNDKELYSKDIVQWIDKEIIYSGYLFWSEDAYGFRVQMPKGYMPSYKLTNDYLEVIGNIPENPELIQK